MRKVDIGIRHSISAGLAFLLAFGPTALSAIPKEQQALTGSVQKNYGLTTAVFQTKAGKINVNFPDDMADTDQISGTVIAEPTGDTPEDRQANADELNGYVVDLKKVDPVPTSSKPNGIHPNSPPFTCGIPAGCPAVDVVLRDPGGSVVCSAQPPCLPTPPPMPCPPDSCILPTVGRCGYPVQIKRPTSGGFSNSKVQLMPQGGCAPTPAPGCAPGPTTMQPLAKSPRQVVVKSPRNIVGSSKIMAKEGNQMATGDFCNLKLSLKSPKTVLHKGETTEVQVIVQGMRGLKGPVQLNLHATGVIELSGGNDQTMMIGGGH